MSQPDQNARDAHERTLVFVCKSLFRALDAAHAEHSDTAACGTCAVLRLASAVLRVGGPGKVAGFPCPDREP